MKKLVVSILALMVTFALVACGGSDPSTSSQVAEQSKQLSRVQKTSASDYETVVQELYVAYFGRPADPNGLANFEGALQSAGAPTDIQHLASAYSSNQAVQQLIDSFGTSKESQNLYGGGSASAGDFVTAVFKNVLGRTPASSGLNYWSGAISSGSLSQGNAALSIMAGGMVNTSAQGLIDAQLIQNRLIVAAYFTGQVSAQNAVSSYSGSAPAQSARTMLAEVTATTDTTAFESTVAATISGLPALVGLCTSSNLSLANYNAISAGMTQAQVNQLLGCQNDSTLTQRDQDYVVYAWDDSRFSGQQTILVYFDASGNVVTGLEGSTTIKSSTGINGTNPTGAACTGANFTSATYNAITLGMTLAQVDQAIGCDNDSILTQRDQDYVVYGWDDQTAGGAQTILVYFDSTGTTVTGLEGSTTFKSSSGF